MPLTDVFGMYMMSSQSAQLSGGSLLPCKKIQKHQTVPLHLKCPTNPPPVSLHPPQTPGIKENIIPRSAALCCKRLVSTNCQIKRSERMIWPTFSRISAKLPPSMFGSALWHPVESNTSDIQTRHVNKQQKLEQ